MTRIRFKEEFMEEKPSHLLTSNPFLKYVLSFRFLYIFLGGFFFFLISISIDPIFIPTLDMPDFWCKKWIEKRIGYRSAEECVEFTSKLEELKYKHNRRMEKRHSYKNFGIFFSATLVTLVFMLLNPSRFFGERVAINNKTGAIATAVFYGVIIGFILPTFYQLLLPPSTEWLPHELFEIRKARVELILREIAEISNI